MLTISNLAQLKLSTYNSVCVLTSVLRVANRRLLKRSSFSIGHWIMGSMVM